jgi:NAD(P)H dehydrogenase (quinone)
MLYFTGFSVVEPFVVHAPARTGGEQRAAELKRYRGRVLSLFSAPTIAYPKLTDYDSDFVLKPTSPTDPQAGLFDETLGR